MSSDADQVTAAMIQLQQSERGRAALRELARLLWADCSWSLDTENQHALVCLLKWSLASPSVRDFVQERTGRLASRPG